MPKSWHGGPLLQTYVIVLLLLTGASAEDEQQPIAQPDFAIYHTKYVLLLHLLACPGISPVRLPSSTSCTLGVPPCCREQILEEVDNIAKANPHIMKVRGFFQYCSCQERTSAGVLMSAVCPPPQVENVEYGDESSDPPYRANMKVSASNLHH